MRHTLFKNNLDEMQEQKQLKNEHIGFWLIYWGLFAAIFIQLALGAGVKELAGEWIVFFGSSIYMVIIGIRSGVWDRHLKPNLKTNILLSLIAGVFVTFFSMVTITINWGANFDNPFILLLCALITGGFTFALTFLALQFTSALYKKRVKNLDAEADEDEGKDECEGKANSEGAFSFRKATAEDGNEVWALFRAAIAKMHLDGMYHWDDEYPARSLIDEDIKKGEMYLGIIGSDIVSAISINSHSEPQYADIDWADKNEHWQSYHRLCVHPDFQGHGIARKTMNCAVAKSKSDGLTSLRFDASTANNAANALYTSLGAKKMGEARFRWRDGIFIIYELLL